MNSVGMPRRYACQYGRTLCPRISSSSFCKPPAGMYTRKNSPAVKKSMKPRRNPARFVCLNLIFIGDHVITSPTGKQGVRAFLLAHSSVLPTRSFPPARPPRSWLAGSSGNPPGSVRITEAPSDNRGAGC